MLIPNWNPPHCAHGVERTGGMADAGPSTRKERIT